MSSKRSTQRAALTVRDVDLKIPRDIQEKDLQALSEAYGLTKSEQRQMAAFLKELIYEFGGHISKVRQGRTRFEDRNNLADAIKQLSRARWHLEACGPVGRTVARNNLSHLGEMFSAGWICQTFPKSAHIPSKEIYEAVNPRSRLTPRFGEQVYVEEHTLQNRRLFARSLNITLVSAVLCEIQQSLEEALRRDKKSGGRSEAKLRSYFIMNLAEFWKQIGRDPFATGKFKFSQFSEHVLNYVGWPTTGLRATIKKALNASQPARN